MTTDEFFSHLLDELHQDDTVMSRSYYKFHRSENDGAHCFRKNYFMRRLNFIAAHAGDTGNKIWDVGCGFGTTDMFLALNGYDVHGITIENQFAEVIARRQAYWSQHGDVSSFSWDYESLFDANVPDGTYDRIIVQDTLHHLEPIDEALQVLKKALKPGGKIIAIEENGNNVIQRARLYKQRGSKRVKEYHDEQLGKTILFGDENIRPLSLWTQLCENNGLKIEEHEYIRLFLSPFWSPDNYAKRQDQERLLYKSNAFLREYFYWGINFTITHA
jgi:SAM-dependent methyltransferase